MAGNPFFQDLDPAGAPDPVTPKAAPGDPHGYGMVTPAGIGPAPYDINAPQDIDGIAAAVSAAGALTGAGIVYPAGPRQAEARDNILETPQGAASANVFAGFPDYEDADVRPPDLNTPIQGQMGTYPAENTYQPGLAQFTAGAGAGVEGVLTPEGSMGGGAGLGYPGTTQPGLQKYGTD